MTSSDDDSKGKPASNVIDITNRLPPVAFGESYSGKIAARVMQTLMTIPAEPHEHIAALMMVSHTLQNYLRHAHNASEVEITHVIERAIEITDNTRIILHIEQEQDEPDKRR